MADLAPATIFGLTVTSFAGWSALYGLACKAQPHRSYEWNCRVVVLVHAITVLTLSTTFGALYNPWPFTHPGRCSLAVRLSHGTSVHLPACLCIIIC